MLRKRYLPMIKCLAVLPVRKKAFSYLTIGRLPSQAFTGTLTSSNGLAYEDSWDKILTVQGTSQPTVTNHTIPVTDTVVVFLNVRRQVIAEGPSSSPNVRIFWRRKCQTYA
ncbi:unnamed protein product [Dicrocoelium dendriticum]|nr:unnamed protein product [Dicrocoelium dendriticum]